jgi:aldose sugar dehydrogenase
MACIGPSDFLVIEKGSGKVKRVQFGAGGGFTVTEVLDLAVNSNSERGLLSIALHPDFARNGWVYLHWTESSTGADSAVVAEVPLLGNRVDRFVWNGASLAFDRNVIKLRSYQEDRGSVAGTAPNQVVSTTTALRGNRNGGKIAFEIRRKAKLNDDDDHDRHGHAGRDDDDDGDDDHGHRPARLFVVIGDNGRRGQMQNLPEGPPGSTFSWTPAGGQDDAFGGPRPDDAHLTGVVLRLNDDGSAPRGNPFYRQGAALEAAAAPGSSDAQVGANLKKVYAYGIRNSFGLAVDPYGGKLWESENSDSAYDEMNRIRKGMNGGWIQLMGPASRVADYKRIEIETAAVVNPGSPNQFVNVQAALQQYRWPPGNIADTATEAVSRLFRLRGANYVDPEFSWRYVNPPAGIGFVRGRGLGAGYEGNLLVGQCGRAPNGARRVPLPFGCNEGRSKFAFSDPRLADNVAPFQATESESLVFGKHFGVVTDLGTGPDGALYVVSISRPLVGDGPSAGPGAIYRIRRP